MSIWESLAATEQHEFDGDGYEDLLGEARVMLYDLASTDDEDRVAAVDRRDVDDLRAIVYVVAADRTRSAHPPCLGSLLGARQYWAKFMSGLDDDERVGPGESRDRGEAALQHGDREIRRLAQHRPPARINSLDAMPSDDLRCAGFAAAVAEERSWHT